MSNWTSDDCAYPIEISSLRFVLLWTASALATVGFVSNCILMRIFLKRSLSEPALVLLALSDTLLCLCYVAIFGIEAAAYYLKIRFFYLAWFWYVRGIFPLSLAVLTSIPSLLILTLAQRCAALSSKSNSCSRLLLDSGNCGLIGLFLVLLAFATRIPMFLTIEVYTFENCTEPFQTKQIFTALHGFYPTYELFLTCVQVFVPFPILLVLNLTLIFKLRIKRRQTQQSVQELLSCTQSRGRRNAAADIYSILTMSMFNELTDDKKNEQNAIISMVIIVCTYLMCNSVHLVCTVLEKWATHVVRDSSGWTDFSHVAKDVVSFLFTLCSVVRLPIYYRFNGLVRRELARVICHRRFSTKHQNRKLLHRTLHENFSFKTNPAFDSEQTPDDDLLGRKIGVVVL